MYLKSTETEKFEFKFLIKYHKTENLTRRCTVAGNKQQNKPLLRAKLN